MKICISNLGSRITDDSLAVVFSTYGHVHESVMVIHEATESKRTAYIDMPNDVEANHAIEKLNGRFIDGQEVEVKRALSTFPFLL